MMKCGRCGRAMVYEQFYGSQEHFWGWRCIFCGEIVDDVILENRQWVKKGVESAKKKLDLRPQEGKGIPRD
ncbi:MAG TPA: hypothetical protein VEK32_09635 [Thermodesulfobacteriota bacterium]|nr:hypothetical protein [Thermodesulfobacteriota bacterium]